MTIKRKYFKPDIEEHCNDLDTCLFMASIGDPVDPPFPAAAPESSPEAAPQFENPSAADYPFGGDSPDFSNM
ncbi:hypothetical protein [Carboxylicivirga sp. RSCT41]|uniref:hypothetical protein n=1 Tax=Carboxylicivirga agarovorans TaxID=3417570 RepID=UPI003D32B6B8